MSEDLVAGIDRLIDGDMTRQERVSLLWALARHQRVRDLLMETVRLDAELLDLGCAYDRAEPRPGALDRIFDAMAADGVPGSPIGPLSGSLTRAMDGVRDALRRMTRMNDAELGMALGGTAPPPDDGAMLSDPAAEDLPPGTHRLPAARPAEIGSPADGPAPRFRLVDGDGGRLAFPKGSGSLRASPSVTEVDLGPAGAMEEGGWVLRLIAGEMRDAGPGRLEIAGTPEAGGCLVLLDGSSLLFTGPLTIRWDPAAEERD